MTNKEYIQRRDSVETYTGYDYLRPDEVSVLRKDVKDACKRHSFQLNGFNNRAIITKNSETGTLYGLRSYWTNVCAYDTATGMFFKLWDGYSATTLRHINIFREYFGLPKLSKREWIELEN